MLHFAVPEASYATSDEKRCLFHARPLVLGLSPSQDLSSLAVLPHSEQANMGEPNEPAGERARGRSTCKNAQRLSRADCKHAECCSFLQVECRYSLFYSVYAAAYWSWVH
jgi:hypothetical protein